MIVAAYSLQIRLHPILIMETHLVDMIRAINVQGILEVYGFTAFIDQHESPPTVGFLLVVGDAMDLL